MLIVLDYLPEQQMLFSLPPKLSLLSDMEVLILSEDYENNKKVLILDKTHDFFQNFFRDFHNFLCQSTNGKIFVCLYALIGVPMVAFGMGQYAQLFKVFIKSFTLIFFKFHKGGSSDVADWYIFSEGFMKEKK
jgi:hypothetical protein